MTPPTTPPTTPPATPPSTTPPVPTPAIPAVAAVDCPTTIETFPTGAELLVGGATVGTTPKKLTLRCGVETKLTLRKFHYGTAVRTIVPKDHGNAVRVKLEKVTFTVKLSSSPPGATVSVGGRSIGVTPTTARLPAFELTSVVFSKAGYTSDTQKLTAKQNNQTLHSLLKKQGK